MTTLPMMPLPQERKYPFDPPPDYAELRAEGRIIRVTTPTGLDAWLVSDYRTIREVLGDGRRFSVRAGQAAHVLGGFDPDAPIGGFSQMDGPEHVRIRRNFAPQVTHARRLAELTPMVERITDEAITRMLASPEPFPLHREFSTAVTTAVIAELIGVPPEKYFLLQDAAYTLFRTETTPAQLQEALRPLFGYLLEQVARRRAAPGDDILSRMILHSADSDRPLTDEELVRMNAALLIAGFDTTASMITYGLVLLLGDRARWETLCKDPSLSATTGEELVRYLAVGVGLLRQATEDTELNGQKIAAGEFVVVAIQSGNRDTSVLPDADTFDLARRPGPHMGFGHGAHACVGQHIARMELKTVLGALATRVPSLRIAVPLADLEWKTDSVVRGPVELPVAWS
ncbi:cytochrome P450 [Catenuloplanes atrovinosus]|uniref:Cytochrome P450 n=1 Tax=Catenuloplanes atrovinosus TaxID=137266 RepID=A0AAE4C983_9ACTN|nr:cytochrome P450 [Catenuloplanes atrovinosus]MDR7275487.1 cytochrome P450 [Catenuloplanes atrovinosus]